MSVVQKVRIIVERPTTLERVLDGVNPNWRAELIYKWQWDPINKKEQDPRKIIPSLDQFEIEERDDGSILYKKGLKFLIESKGPFKSVLTNIEPETKDKRLYDPDAETKGETVSYLSTPFPY